MKKIRKVRTMKIRQNKSKYNVGKNIKILRNECNLTQEQVVCKMQLLGIQLSRSYYSQIEMGIANIKVEELLALCIIFDCQISDFFKGMELNSKEF